MKLWRRRRPQVPAHVLDPFPGDPITDRLAFHAWLRQWADSAERIAAKSEAVAVGAFYAGVTTALREVAAEVSRHAFVGNGPVHRPLPMQADPWAITETRTNP